MKKIDMEPKIRKISVRLTEDEHERFKKLCHTRFTTMAEEALRLIQIDLEKAAKKNPK